MSFYNTSDLPSFGIKKSNRVETAIQDNIAGLVDTTTRVLYATFERSGDAYYIKPINIDDCGYFVVSEPAPTMTVEFFANSPYKRVIGMISYGRGYSVSQPSANHVVFQLENTDIDPLFATMSFNLTK